MDEQLTSIIICSLLYKYFTGTFFVCLEEMQALSKDRTQNLIQLLHHAHISRIPDTSLSVLPRVSYDPVNCELKYSPIPSPPPQKKKVKGSNNCSKIFHSVGEVWKTHNTEKSIEWMKSSASDHQTLCHKEKKVSLLEDDLLSGREPSLGQRPPSWLSVVPVC